MFVFAHMGTFREGSSKVTQRDIKDLACYASPPNNRRPRERFYRVMCVNLDCKVTNELSAARHQRKRWNQVFLIDVFFFLFAIECFDFPGKERPFSILFVHFRLSLPQTATTNETRRYISNRSCQLLFLSLLFKIHSTFQGQDWIHFLFVIFFSRHLSKLSLTNSLKKGDKFTFKRGKNYLKSGINEKRPTFC